MDIKLLLLSILFFIIGIIIIIKYKFYKYPSDDMSFATELKVFLGGLLFCLIGVFGIINQILKIIQ